MNKSQAMIYHIVTESDFCSQLESRVYTPLALSGDGFVHCSLEASVLPVANDYFANVSGRLLLLEMDPGRLSSETRYDAPAPLAAGASSHLTSGSVFPHVYGPINTDAITRVGLLGRTAAGYEWPRSFTTLDTFLTADG